MTRYRRPLPLASRPASKPSKPPNACWPCGEAASRVVAIAASSHALSTETRPRAQRSKTAMAVPDMLDVGVAGLFEGADHNQPSNAVTLSPDMHAELGRFKML
jgi:hypothetical protein